MHPPVEIRDRTEYKRRMSRSIAWVLTVDEFKARVLATKQVAAVA